ncbi:3'-kinase [Glaciihabitans sp. INWT7]|uniref:aminoglycoside phosphotransferase family protein n=1 Tax=Glaciihabitans sp. INWT7 TaxID=2596912 RepID=UPI001625FD74|nr:aminoglycoside phosphotransferase family protein [Glaciihabitans sp. INWT7]QNE46397.1 3'-kinase [Glaciihabitans sp. INWT7]
MEWVAGSVPVYVDRWAVQPHGETVTTPSSWLVPGRWHDRDVMLKVARIAEEGRGGTVLAWWSGDAAAEVYEVSDQAVLMERASGRRDLTTMCQTGLDDEATNILCATISFLHGASAISAAPVGVVPLSRWFQDLVGADAARFQAGSMARAAVMARELLEVSHAEGQVVLHGDLHHGNVLDFDGRWLAIDPKGLFGYRAFDYANIFCNPTADVAVSNFHRRLAIVSEHSGLDAEVLRSWVMAWCALSVTWTDSSGAQPWTAHAILSEFG